MELANELTPICHSERSEESSRMCAGVSHDGFFTTFRMTNRGVHWQRSEESISMAASTKNHRYWVYIVANKPNGTICIGVTNSLERRIWEHKTGKFAGFTKNYGLKTLVHFEEYREITDAITREKELKGWLRARKAALIRENNPLWEDLAAEWYHVQTDSSLPSR